MPCAYLAGLWAVFVKSGLKGWWALVPCARQYKLGLCAGREPEGRTLAVLDFLMIAYEAARHAFFSWTP